MADDYSRITGGDEPLTVMHPATNLNQSDVAEVTRASNPDTGDLRRSYDFGSSYTKISFLRDPYLHHLNMMRKVPTTDPNFKVTSKKQSAALKRFGYVMGMSAAGEVSAADQTVTATTAWDTTRYLLFLAATVNGNANMYASAELPAADSTFSLLMMGDFTIIGQKENRIGQAVSDGITLGGAGTKPNYIHPNQILRIPTTSTTPTTAAGAVVVEDYALVRVLSTYTMTGSAYGEALMVNVLLLKRPATALKPTSYRASSTFDQTTALLTDTAHGTAANSIAQKLEPMRTYVSGTAYHELSGFGEVHRDKEYRVDNGLTQIFKKEAIMSYRAMSTELKFEQNPWSEEWNDKMLEMNLDMARTAYFGEQMTDADGITYTEGIVNYILNNGNQFALDLTSKTYDDFLEDMSAFNDPRYSPTMGSSKVYYCNTQVWNWFGRIGTTSYMKNVAEESNNYRISASGSLKKLVGVPTRVLDVDGTTMKLVRDIHLDGTNVKLLGIDMNGTAIRPLIGNGISNDVHVHQGVKTKANTGESRRVDIIDADLGFHHSKPYLHAVWL